MALTLPQSPEKPWSGTRTASVPAWSAVLELLKPITWFPPMWAYACGVVSSGQPMGTRITEILIGVLLAGPLVCGTSQAVNDWYDREVDAINEPGRPIPSGRVPGRWGLYVGLISTGISLLVGGLLGKLGFAAAVFGLAIAWAYSAPPLRLKLNGWWGNAAVASCYEGLPWFTGAALSAGIMPSWQNLALAGLYSVGAHGIMTLNDFKSIEGDTRLGIRSLPVQLGAARAGLVACAIMSAPQAVVAGLLMAWGASWHSVTIGVLLLVQLGLMRRLLTDPRGLAPWYNGTGILLYVAGMMVAAFAVRGM